MDSYELKSKAISVNILLDKYIALHNEYIKKSNSIFKVFTPINFTQFAGDSYLLFEQLRDETKALKGIDRKQLNTEQREFIDALRSYADALKDTCHKFFILLKALEAKAKGEKLSFEEHRKNMRDYENARLTYYSQGEKLNELYNNLS